LSSDIPQNLIIAGLFGDTMDIGSFSMNPVNSYDNFTAKLQWAGSTGGNEILTEKQHFNVYPNPASDILTVSIENESVIRFEIIDKTGRQILKSDNLNSVKNNETSIHAGQTYYNIGISGLHTGLYILNIYTRSNKLLSKKVVVK
jgi:hypothetical protein